MIIKVDNKDVETYLIPYYKEVEKLNTVKCSMFSVDTSMLSAKEKNVYINTLISDFVCHRILERDLYYKIRERFNLPTNFFLDYNKITYNEEEDDE